MKLWSHICFSNIFYGLAKCWLFYVSWFLAIVEKKKNSKHFSYLVFINFSLISLYEIIAHSVSSNGCSATHSFTKMTINGRPRNRLQPLYLKRPQNVFKKSSIIICTGCSIWRKIIKVNSCRSEIVHFLPMLIKLKSVLKASQTHFGLTNIESKVLLLI